MAGRKTYPTLSPVQLFGHVNLVEGYALTSFKGCHALVALRDTPGKTVAVITPNAGLQNLLVAALTSGRLIAFTGGQYTGATPLGSGFTVDVYDINDVILYNMP
jgi:hypothetical protein